MDQTTTIQTQILHGLGDTCLMIGDLAEQLDLTSAQISQAAAHLIMRGLVERIDRGCYQLTVEGRAARDSGLTIETGVTGRRRPRKTPRASIRQRAWSAMRLLRTFTVPELVTVVARTGDGNVTENLRRYVSALTMGGYLARAQRRRPGTAPGSNGFPIYSLVTDTGELAPVWSQERRAFRDFNVREAAR